MRDFKGMKRQRGRNRGGGGSSGGGGKPQAQNANRAFDSNGPEGSKVRGNAQHVFEKYQQLARDAQASGDRVLGENYLQHAEHYFRLLRAMQPTRPASEILGRDHFSSGFDIDFEDESAQAQSEAADQASAEAGDTPETWQAGQAPQQQAREDRPQNRDERPRDDRPRYENRDRDFNRDGQAPREGREGQSRDGQYRDAQSAERQSREGQNREGQNRDGQSRDGQNRDAQTRDGQGGRRDRWRDDRPRGEDRPQTEGQQQPRDERPRDDRPREDRPRDDRPRNRDDRPRYNRDERPQREPAAAAEPQAPPQERGSPVLRDSEGGESYAPAFLQTSAAPRPEPAGDAPKPRRKRATKAASSEPEEA